MSLYSSLQTSVSGMAAQASALSTISDNIANSSTTGYKRASAEFETVLGSSTPSTYQSGGVTTDVRYGVTDQGTLSTTSSVTDLAIKGNGFFNVSKDGQGSYLTRAGSFIQDATGNLVNSAGYNLMAYAVQPDGTPSSTLSVVNIDNSSLQAAASTSGTFAANLPSSATTITTPKTTTTSGGVTTTTGNDTPGNANDADNVYTDKTSITTYDKLGTAVVLDVYATKTGTGTWQIAAYDQSGASASGGFPYASGNVGTTTLNFDPTSGNLTSTSAKALTITLPSGNTVPIDLSSMTQLATGFSIKTANADGNAPSKLDHITIGANGTITSVYASGFQKNTYDIPLSTVESPDNLTQVSGNVYQVSQTSGSAIIATAGGNGVGSIVSGSLEQSTVDLATELTNMIQAQRGYEANSKVLQASSDLLGVLNRITTS